MFKFFHSGFGVAFHALGFFSSQELGEETQKIPQRTNSNVLREKRQRKSIGVRKKKMDNQRLKELRQLKEPRVNSQRLI